MENQKQSSKEVIAEGFINQLVTSMLQEIPEYIYENSKGLIDVEEETEKLIRNNLIQAVSSESTRYEVVTAVAMSETDKLVKRKNYQLKILSKMIDEDYKKAISGETIEAPASPFSEITLSAYVQMGKTRDEAVAWVRESIDDFFGKITVTSSVKKTAGSITGISQYPYFYLIKNQDKTRAKKFVLIDLTEYIFRLSFMDKYKNYIYYAPESFSQGFYSESAKGRSRVEIDPEYAQQAELLLRERFFPEVADVQHVSIKAPSKQWDFRDYQGFAFMISKSVSEGFSKNETLSIEGNIADICSVMFPETKHASSRHYTMAKERLRNLFGTQLVATDGNGKETFRSIFDSAEIYDSKIKEGTTDAPKKSEKNTAVFRAEFGKSITADILSNRLDTIVRPRFNDLETEISKMLYTRLKRDRTADLIINHRAGNYYSQIALMLIIRLNDSKVARRIERYSEALSEMKDKGILIRDFHKVKGPDGRVGFDVEWLPLSAEESRDLRVLYNQDNVISITEEET